MSGGIAVVTPSPQHYIQFQSGDVFGFYVEEARDDDNGVVILTSFKFPTNFTIERVWYASIAPTVATSQNGDCPYSVGSNDGVLNNLTQAAPVIAILTGTLQLNYYTNILKQIICYAQLPFPVLHYLQWLQHSLLLNQIPPLVNNL